MQQLQELQLTGKPLPSGGAQEAVAAEVLRRLTGEDAAAALAGKVSQPRLAGNSSRRSSPAADSAAAAGVSSGDEEEGIAVGPQHQADLPLLRPLPALSAAAALLELRKAGRPGPPQNEALAIAIEVRPVCVDSFESLGHS
jgi:hypothetical protein